MFFYLYLLIKLFFVLFKKRFFTNVLVDFIEKSVNNFHEYFLLDLKFSIFYRNIYLFFLNKYFMFFIAKRKFFISLEFIYFFSFFFSYIPIFFFLVVLYIEVLFFSKIEYVYFVLNFLLFNRLFNVVFKQFYLVINWFLFYLNSFISCSNCDINNLHLFFATGDYSLFIFKIDYNSSNCFGFFEYYKSFYPFVRNLNDLTFYSVDYVLERNLYIIFFKERLRFLYLCTSYIVLYLDTFRVYKEKHDQFSNFFRLLFLIMLMLFVLLKNYNIL